MKKVYEVKDANNGRMVRVYRDSEWNEYRTRCYMNGVLNPDADAFDSDKQSAIETADAIIKFYQK